MSWIEDQYQAAVRQRQELRRDDWKIPLMREREKEAQKQIETEKENQK